MAGAHYGKQLKHPKKELKISESYIIEVDISENRDLSVLMVSRLDRNKMAIVHTFNGSEAEEMYERLTGQKLRVIQDE